MKPSHSAHPSPMSETQSASEKRYPLLLKLSRPYLPWIALSILFGALGGGASAMLVSTTNALLHNTDSDTTATLLYTFVGLGLAAIVARFISGVSTNYVGQHVVAKLRLDLARKILCAPIDELEHYRAHRLVPVLTQDVDMVGDVVFQVAELIVASAIVIGCFFYLATLSLPLFGLFFLTLVLGSAIQSYAQRIGVKGFEEARDREEFLHKLYRGMSDGAKELRMQRLRRTHFFDKNLVGTINSIRTVVSNAINTYLLASGLAAALLYCLIGMVIGLGNKMRLDPEVISGFILVLFFANGAFSQVIGILPGLGRAKVAFLRILDLSKRFANPEPNLYLDKTETAETRSIQRLEIKNAVYAYPSEDPSVPPFTLGPIDLHLDAGEIIFIVGNNGSGKTTLIKVLLGLYSPQQGEVLIDGHPITTENRDDYRQLFSTVFTDFYLFEDLPIPGTAEKDASEKARPYLEKLEIDHKVSVKDGKFTTLDLSTGQRKRLALVHAYLESRPIIVFDEWAADQDPHFRHIFYTEILPELKNKGHLLIIISHDDRYFNLADSVIKIDNGKKIIKR